MPDRTHRYDRQKRFRPIGEVGQQRLNQARVAIVGVGALGTHVASWLTRAGVGFLRLVDRDLVEDTNLQRQILFDERDADGYTPKALAAVQKLRATNSGVSLEAVTADLNWRNAEQLLSDVDVIVDGTDNLAARRLINDVSVKLGIPWAYGGVVSSYGSAAFFIPGETPCFACLYPQTEADNAPDTCDTVGVIAPAVAMVAALQAADTMKWLVGDQASIVRGMHHVDGWAGTLEEIAFGLPRPDCNCCGQRIFETLRPVLSAITIRLCGRDTVQISPALTERNSVSLPELRARLKDWPHVRSNANLLQCKVEDCVLTVFKDGRVLVQGTAESERALELYRRLPI